MKKFAVFDIDGTLFRWQLFHEIVFELIQEGHIPESAKKSIDEKMQAWRNRAHSQSFKEYEMALVNAFVPCMKGLKVGEIEKAADKILKKSGNEVYAYTRNLIEELRKQDYTLIAISGSQDEIVQRFAALWHFDIAIGQQHDIEDEQYTGTLTGGKLLVEQKGAVLKEIVGNHTLSWEDSFAVGDSLSDAGMLELVTNPIAFNPNDPLFDIAKKEGWKVVIERKNMTYELESRDGTYLLANASTW